MLNEKEVAVVGAGGHARSVISLLKRLKFQIKEIYDITYLPDKEERISGILLKGTYEDIQKNISLVIAIGDNKKRAEFFEKYQQQVYDAPLVDPYSKVDENVRIGNATIVMANTFINAEVRIGDNNLLNTGCIIEHECCIGHHNHISVGTILGGRVTIGNYCFLGAGAILRDNINIGDNVTIGAGE